MHSVAQYVKMFVNQLKISLITSAKLLKGHEHAQAYIQRVYKHTMLEKSGQGQREKNSQVRVSACCYIRLQFR